MPTTQTILTAFVASPSDVKEERAALEEVVIESNIAWSNTFNTRLDLFRWETHAAPGIADDAQEVINEQTPPYDIFIAIFWGRIGTPTNRAESGTLEEFNRAYEKYKNNPNSVQIMVYFKETPMKLSQIDSDQLKKVREFKASLDKKGLYFEFDSIESFKKLLRNHLNQKIRNWSNPNNGKLLTQNGMQVSLKEQLNVTNELIDGEEVLEKIRDSIPLFERTSFSLNHIVTGVEDLFKKLSKLETNTKEPQQTTDFMMKNGKGNLRMVTLAADFLTDFIFRMKCENSLFESTLRKALKPYSNLPSKRNGFITDNTQIIHNALTVVSGFRSETVKANAKVKQFRRLLDRFPWKGFGYDRVFNDAFEAVDELISHIENGKQQATKLEAYFSELI